MVLVGSGWSWLVLVGPGWFWLVLVGSGWFWLVLVLEWSSETVSRKRKLGSL